MLAKYGLNSEAKAAEISDFLTGAHADSVQGEVVTPEIFSEKFGVPPEEAAHVLEFVNIGVRFKDQQLKEAKALYKKV